MRLIFFILVVLSLLFPASAFAAISFSISNTQQNNDEITIDVSLSGLTSSSCPNTYCYLQAAFTAPSPVKYFGFTKNHTSQWYEYISSPDSQYIQSTFFAFLPIDGTWTGQLILKVNSDDVDYKGPGTYNVKAWRYTGNSNSYSGSSNVLETTIAGPTPTLSPSPNPSNPPSPTVKPTSTPTPKKTAAPTPSPSFTPAPVPSKTPVETAAKVTLASKRDYRIASVAAATSPAAPSASSSSSPFIKSQKQANPLIWLGTISLLLAGAGVGYIYLKTNGKLHFPFRKRN